MHIPCCCQFVNYNRLIGGGKRIIKTKTALMRYLKGNGLRYKEFSKNINCTMSCNKL